MLQHIVLLYKKKYHSYTKALNATSDDFQWSFKENFDTPAVKMFGMCIPSILCFPGVHCIKSPLKV